MEVVLCAVSRAVSLMMMAEGPIPDTCREMAEDDAGLGIVPFNLPLLNGERKTLGISFRRLAACMKRKSV